LTRILPIASGEKIRRFTYRDRPIGSLQEFRARSLSPDGKIQAYFSRDSRELLVRDVATGRLIRRFPYLRHTRGEIDETWETHIVFSPDNKLLAAGDTPTSLCLWSLETGKAYRRFPHQDAGHGIAFTPDGKQLITGGMHFRYWDIVKGREVRRFPKQSEVQAVAFGPKGETLATADDATVRLWEASTGRPLRQYLGHRADVFEVAIDPDGKFLASGDAEGTLILWDFNTGKELRRRVQGVPVAASGEEGSRYPEIPSIAFSPDGKTLAATDQRGASLFDAVSGREVLRFPRFNRTVRNLAFAQDGKTLAAVYGHGVLLWDVATGREKHKLDHLQVVEAAAFGPEGKTLATVDSLGGFGVWDLDTGRRLREFHAARQPDDERQGGTSLAFLPDGKTLAVTMDGDETVQIWDIATGQLRRRLAGHAGEVNAVTLSPEGKTLASSSDDGTTLLWEVSRITAD
jgi:WD40 repeat protein